MTKIKGTLILLLAAVAFSLAIPAMSQDNAAKGELVILKTGKGTHTNPDKSKLEFAVAVAVTVVDGRRFVLGMACNLGLSDCMLLNVNSQYTYMPLEDTDPDAYTKTDDILGSIRIFGTDEAGKQISIVYFILDCESQASEPKSTPKTQPKPQPKIAA